MTVPSEYLRATEHFYAFLLDACDTAGLGAHAPSVHHGTRGVHTFDKRH